MNNEGAYHDFGEILREVFDVGFSTGGKGFALLSEALGHFFGELEGFCCRDDGSNQFFVVCSHFEESSVDMRRRMCMVKDGKHCEEHASFYTRTQA